MSNVTKEYYTVPSVCGRSPLLEHFYAHFVSLYQSVQQMLSRASQRGPLPDLPSVIPQIQYIDVGLIGLHDYRAVALHIDHFSPTYVHEYGMRRVHELLNLRDDCVVIQMTETTDDTLERKWKEHWWEGLAEVGVTFWEHLSVTGYWNMSKAMALYNAMRGMYDFLESGAWVYLAYMIVTPFLVEMARRMMEIAAATRIAFTTAHGVRDVQNLRIQVAQIRHLHKELMPDGMPLFVYGIVKEGHPLKRYVQEVVAKEHPIYWIRALNRGWKGQLVAVREWRRRVLVPMSGWLRRRIREGRNEPLDERVVAAAKRLLDTSWDIPAE